MLNKNIILGIDPGLATTGYGLIHQQQKNKITLIDYGVITTKAHTAFINRLEEIHKKLDKIIKKYQPYILACEELFFSKNTKTALLVGQARGVILLTARQHRLAIQEFTPLQIKQTISGYGQAGKAQMQKMVSILLNLKKIPYPDDAADALAVALTCQQYLNSPLYDQK